MPGSRKLFLLSGVLALVTAFGAAPAALGCSSKGYTYAGLASLSTTHGVAARLTAIGAPAVANGHVAGWVGVGGPGEGPNGSDEWIQVGFSGFAGSPDSDLYYEVTKAGYPPRYVQVERDLPPGTSRRVAVLEVAGQPNAWRVWVDGRPVSGAIYLPGSHGVWRGIATAENWNDDSGAGCNSYGYRFDDIRIAHQAGGAWTALADALPIRTGANRLLRPATASFEAVSGRPIAPSTFVAAPITRSLTRALP